MKERLKNIITVIFCLLSVQLSAKTIYYVKSGATGTGTSWSNASGSIQDMIDEASPGDEVWIAGGTYYPEKEYEWSSSKDRTFKLKSGVSLYGGFFGSETSIQQRKKTDRDNNGKVEDWEFQYETTLSGDGDVKDVWTCDDDNRILEVANFEDNSEIVIRLSKDDFDNNSPFNEFFYFSGLSVTAGIYGVDVSLLSKVDCRFIIQECNFYFNGNGLFGDGFCIEKSNLHHNFYSGIESHYSFFVQSIMNHIHHNIVSGINGATLAEDCIIYCNGEDITDYSYAAVWGVDTVRNCLIYSNLQIGGCRGVFYNCDIYDNSGRGLSESTAYNCHIYGNKGGGTFIGDLYDCIIENNTGGGGTSGSSLYNCIIRNNFTVGNGGGCSDGYLRNCKIYNNESLFDGGGVSGGSVWGCSIFNNKAGGSGGGISSDGEYNNGKYYNCDIYNNSAVSYGGVSSGSYTNCTIANNKTFSGNDNTGYLINCILKGTFGGSASYSVFTDSYIQGDGNFLVTEKELKFAKSTSFIGNASNEKQLTELNNADFSLTKGSIAIDMGESGYLVPVDDKSGYPRPMGEKTDIGAHEYFTLKTLPYENKFDVNSFSMNYLGKWRNNKLPGKDDYFLYYDGEVSTTSYNIDLNYVTTSFFDKTVSNKINLSFDVAAKYKTKDQQEKMHVILAYLDSNKQDTIMTFSNTDYIQDLHFSKKISSWVKNKVFRVLFAVEDSKSSDYNKKSSIVYCGITNLKITKQDASVEIIAEDKVYMYDGKSHAIDYQINDTRVDKKKAVVTYQKEGETTSTTTPPVKAGIYQAQISIEDGAYFGMKEVKLTIEKANQTIQWAQQLRTMKAKEKMQLEATATSGLPVSFSSEDETRAKVESINGKWWLVADTVPGEVSIKASQLGNENYNLANSVLKTIRIESVPTGILSVTTNKATAYFVKAENCISVKNIHPNSQLYLYDSLGHLCIMKDADNTEMQIPVHELSKGVYYLLVIDRSEKENFKILIN